MLIAQLIHDDREVFRDYGASRPRFGTAPDALVQGLASQAELEVHVISCLQRPVQSPEKLAPNIWYHALHVPKLGWLRTGYQGCVRAIRKKLRQIRPDVVHGQGTERDCAISAIFSGWPNVITIHGHMRRTVELERSRPFSYNWLTAKLERLTIPRTGGVVCLNRYTQQRLSGLARRTWIVPNAVDPAFFAVQPAPASDRTVLCVGAVILWKNQHQLIRALDPLAREKPFRLVFLGAAPPETPYAAAFLKLLETRPWCVHAGFAGREELREHLSRASLLVLPSIQDNCPMVILEAMAAGLPVCGARIGGVPDLIDDGVTGLLFDPGDPAAIRQAVARLLDEPALARQLAERARQQALARHHPEQIARQHVGVYRDLLADRGYRAAHPGTGR